MKAPEGWGRYFDNAASDRKYIRSEAVKCTQEEISELVINRNQTPAFKWRNLSSTFTESVLFPSTSGKKRNQV